MTGCARLGDVGPNLPVQVMYLPADTLERVVIMSFERHAVDAETLARRRRTIGEDMSQVAAAPLAVDFCPSHEETVIDGRSNGVLQRRPEARPAGSALELRVRRKERLSACGAHKGAGALFIIERTGSGALGAVVAQNVKLLGSERPPPFVFRLLNNVFRVSSHTLIL